MATSKAPFYGQFDYINLRCLECGETYSQEELDALPSNECVRGLRRARCACGNKINIDCAGCPDCRAESKS